MNNVSDAVERHYWKAVTFLVILILVGSGFWGLRRFAPAVFLGKPDLIAVPSTPEFININTASIEEIHDLLNIDEQMAQKIIDHREQYGEFNSIDDLESVKGLDAKTLEKLRSAASSRPRPHSDDLPKDTGEVETFH